MKYSLIALINIAACLASFHSQAVEIRIDYRYDTNNFFDTAEKRHAIEAVANFYSELLTNSLARIDPSEFRQASWVARTTDPQTGNTVSIPNLVVPEDTIIVFVGAREISGNTVGIAGPGGYSAGGFNDWFDRIEGRGNPEATREPESQRTEFATWGGTIAFDTPRNWNFSLSENRAGTEFISIALHEMGHVLGLGTADAWDNRIVNGQFTGTAAAASFGSPPPADSGHFLNDLESDFFGSFAVQHGKDGPVLMLASSFDDGSNFDVISDLDLAALTDIGWDVDPEVTLDPSRLNESMPTLAWPSVSFKNYRLERITDLTQSNPSTLNIGSGSGGRIIFTDTDPASDQAFYRLESSDRFQSSSPQTARRTEATQIGPHLYQTRSKDPIMVENCCAF